MWSVTSVLMPFDRTRHDEVARRRGDYFACYGEFRLPADGSDVAVLAAGEGLATMVVGAAGFESRMVKWRTGQDETANTYVIELAL
jgi:hypothetical protein